jgi:hypothetical protein
MFPRRFFARAFFPVAYFPPTGEVAPPTEVSARSQAVVIV